MGCAAAKLTDEQSKQLAKKFEHSTIVGEAINRIRKNPSSLIPHLQKQLKHFEDEKFIKLHSNQMFCQSIFYETIQGTGPWKEAKKFLKSTYPLSYPLQKNSVLCETAAKKAMEFVHKQQKLRSQKSLSSKDLAEEIRLVTGAKVKQGQFGILIGMDFKLKDRDYVQNALLGLIVDDGVHSRSNRNLIFSQKFKYYGSYTTITQDHIIVVIYLSSENLIRVL